MILEGPPTPAPETQPQAVPTEGDVLPRTGIVNRIAWSAIVLMLLVQFGLFRQFALREVVWSYPANYDQLAYLEQSYQTYEKILDHGLVHGILEGMGIHFGHLRMNAAGASLHVQAAVLYLFTGPSRFSAISLNFLYFALLQCVLVATVGWLTGRWSAAFVALGLLLTTTTAFYYAGGLFDFRLDFIAMCLFGVCVCLAIRSNLFADWKWAAVTGVVLAVLGTFRFVTLAHLAGIGGLFFCFLIVRWLVVRRDPRRRHVERQIIGSVLAGVILVAVAAPVLWHHRQAIHDYYVIGHVSGPEKNIRAAEAGITSRRADLEYYPISLWRDHAGIEFFRLSGMVLLITAAGLALRWALGKARERSNATREFDYAAACLFVVLCVLVPLAVLTRDVAKSPVVADVAVVPLVWVVLLAVLLLSGIRRGSDLILRGTLFASAALALWTAAGLQFSMYARRTPVSQNRDGIERLLAMYDQMTDECRLMGWSAPAVATDCISADFMAPKNLSVLSYERKGAVIDAGQSLGRLEAYDTSELFDRLRHSDFVLLSHRTGGAPPFYPFDVQMEQMHPQLMTWCSQNLIELRSVHVFERDVTLYLRPAVQMQAAADGWITSDGLTLTVPGQVLRSAPHVELRGQADFRLLHGTPHVHAKLIEPGQQPVDVPSTITVTAGTDYVLTIDVDPTRVTDDAPAHVLVTFDEHFVPKQLGTSDDPRELVMQMPTSATLHH